MIITSNFFIDLNLINDKDKIKSILNSRSTDITETEKYSRYRRDAFDYIENLIKKYSDNRKYYITLEKETFAITLWILKYINENSLINRFIIEQRDVFENKIIEISKENYDNIIQYFDALGIHNTSVENNNFFKIPFDIFIRYNKKLSGNTYRLIYQMLNNGYVYIDIDQVAHILREYFVFKMHETYNKMKYEDANYIFEGFYSILDKLKEDFIKENSKNTMNLGKVDFSIFPPCVKEIINEIKDGGNPSHMARFTLATFLHKIGMGNNEIVKIFSNTADFDEKSASYQVDHLTGVISGTEYTPPKCSTLKSNHLCYMGDDPLCPHIKHPLQYYEIKAKDKIKKSKS